MRKIFFITTLLWLANVNAQFFIGIPFLDRCRNMSKCDLCNPKSPKTIEYLDSLDVLLKNAIVNDENLSALNQLKIIDDEIVRYNSMYATHQPDLTVEKEIYGRLLIVKTKLLIESVIEKDNKIYNLFYIVHIFFLHTARCR